MINDFQYISNDIFLGIGQQALALIVLCLTTMRLYMIRYRVLQKNLQIVMSSICVCVLIGLSLFLFSNLIPENGFLIRLIRYSIIFEQLVAAYGCILLIGFIGNPHTSEQQQIMRNIGIMAVVLCGFFILSNDWHQQMFEINFDINGRSLFNVNWGYIVVIMLTAFGDGMASLIIAFRILRSKSVKGKIMLWTYLSLTAAYALLYLYLNYNLFLKKEYVAWQNDRGLIIGFLTLCFINLILQSELIPTNSNYYELFENSSLKLLITDNDFNIVFKSKDITTVEKEELQEVVRGIPEPYSRNDEQMIYAVKLPSGYAFYAQDVTELKKMQKETADTLQSIRKLNEMLALENSQKLSETRSKISNELMNGLDSVVMRKTKKLSGLIKEFHEIEKSEKNIETNKSGSLDNFQNEITSGEYWQILARITLLLVYVKRNCILYFLGRQDEEMPVEELYVYMDELAEFAGYANIRCMTGNHNFGNIKVNFAAFCYDFFFHVIDLAGQMTNPILIEEMDCILGADNRISTRMIEVHIMTSFEIGDLNFIKGETLETVVNYGGSITLKELEDAYDICLSIPVK